MAEAYIEVINNFDNTASHRGRAIQSPYNKKIMYIFLQVNKIPEEEYEEYRVRRRKFAEMYCEVINARFEKIENIVAIVSEPPKFNQCLSRDFILYSCQKLSHGDKVQIFKMQMKLNILTGSNPIYHNDIHKKVGRNDFCPCGSGLKYKKCCLNK